MENIFQRGDAHFVACNTKFRHINIEICKEILQINILRNPKSYFRMDLILKRDLAQFIWKIRTDHSIFLVGQLSHRYLGPWRETIFQELATSQTLQRAFCHNANTVSKQICFIHELGGQNDYSVATIVLQHIPQASSCILIHACGWLIEQHKSGFSAERNCNWNLPFVASTQRRCYFRLVFCKSQVGNQISNLTLFQRWLATFQFVKKV